MKDHISVCICTYHRNQMLERLLKKLALQETNGLFDYSIVIVDNDEAGPSEETIMRLKNELGLNITYGIESVQTIPAVRNHALRLAKGNYIGIIDDDEFPPPHWLVTMYKAIQTFDVEGALGPVHPFFEHHPPDWLIKSRFCERPVLRTGTLFGWHQTRTGNVLLKKEVFDKHHLRFDEAFKTGGSDQAFFRAAMQKGCRFIACAEAPVYEVVPPERQTIKYYTNRALVNGFNAQKYAKGLSKLVVPCKSAVALFTYLLLFPFSVFTGMHRAIQCLEKGSYHLSRLLATFGIEIMKRRNF